MPTIQVEADISLGSLVAAAEQLSASELRQLATEVLTLQARRQARSLSAQETDLMLTISRCFEPEDQQRFEELVAKRDAEMLSREEHQELLRLTQAAEALDAARVEALAKLAELRGTTLSNLMRELEVQPSAHE
jgi:hypothetical protein